MGRKGQKPLFHAIEKLPYKLDLSRISEKEAKEWLFLKCLSIYGPFTIRDGAHWVGWNITETKEILSTLLEKGKTVNVSIEDHQEKHYVRVRDLPFLNSLKDNLPGHSFVRILSNDDALLLGYYERLKNYFGYHWKYPQFGEGIVWRAAILYGRDLIGGAIVEMYVKSRFFKVKKLILRKEFISSEILSEIKYEFKRHAKFQNKILKITSPKLLRF